MPSDSAAELPVMAATMNFAMAIATLANTAAWTTREDLDFAVTTLPGARARPRDASRDDPRVPRVARAAGAANDAAVPRVHAAAHPRRAGAGSAPRAIRCA